MPGPFPDAPRFLSSFRKDRRGIAAIEFALIATFILIPIMFGLIEIMTLYRADTKLASFAASTAEMVAIEQTASTGISTVHATSGSGTSLQDICQGAILGLWPMPSNGVTVNIASVTLEDGPTGTANTQVHANTAAYNVWEQDFTVSGSTCTAAATTNIGSNAAVTYATSSPPSLTGTTSATGLVEVPCDNMIIVQATLTYPGIVGVVLRSRPIFAQTAGMRWHPATVSSELECLDCTLPPALTFQYCNSSNTGN